MIHLFISNAFAQEATAAAAKQPMIMQFLPMILIVVVFYFLMLRPQKKQLEEEGKMINALSKGDEIYTKSGLLGTITGLTEKVVTIEVSEGVKLKVLKSHIAGLSSKLFAKESK